MPTIADEKFRVLRAAGHTGTLNDMMLQWLNAKAGVSASTLADASRQWLVNATGLPDADYQYNDYLFHYLGTQGHTGSLNDRILQFWSSQ